MAFSDHKIAAFTHKITDLPDQPNLPADELKARFDSSPEELRVAHNALCDDADRLDDRVSGIIAETFGDTISKSMLSDELQDEIDAKAEAADLTAEQTAREAADSALSTRVSTAESTITTHTSQIAQKCEIYCGTYTGDGASSRTITLGFKPKAVFVLQDGTMLMGNYYVYGSLASSTRSARRLGMTTMTIASNGFKVYQDEADKICLNEDGYAYLYIAFQ